MGAVCEDSRLVTSRENVSLQLQKQDRLPVDEDSQRRVEIIFPRTADQQTFSKRNALALSRSFPNFSISLFDTKYWTGSWRTRLLVGVTVAIGSCLMLLSWSVALPFSDHINHPLSTPLDAFVSQLRFRMVKDTLRSRR